MKENEKKAKNQVTIVMYHYVRSLSASRYPRIKGLTINDFQQQLKFLLNNFTIIKIEDLIAFYDDPKNNSLPANSCLLTFDDGYLDHFTNVFPILDSLGIQGSFYIPAKTFVEGKVLDVNKIHFILATTKVNLILEELWRQLDYYRGAEYNLPTNQELFAKYAMPSRFDSKEVIFIKRILQTVLPQRLRTIITNNLFIKYLGTSEEVFAKELYLNLDQIKCMKNHGMQIGVHGYNHDWLGNLPQDELEADLNQALDSLSSVIDLDSWVMNYPYGSYSDQVIDFIQNLGCKLAFTTKVAVADLEDDDRYLLPRLDTNDLPPKTSSFSSLSQTTLARI